MERKKLTIYNEVLYLLALLLMALSVAMTAASDFGLSMIAAPAYIVSEKFSWLTMGQAEYIVEGVIFILFCILLRKVRLVYFLSFASCLVYGAVLDLFRMWIPILNPEVTPAGSMDMPVRLVLFVFGMCLTALAVAMFFRCYLYPQVFDFFVKGVTEHFNLNKTKFKRAFDAGMLLISCLLTFILFRKLVGIGVGTIIMTLMNGIIIGLWGKLLDRYICLIPIFPKLEEKLAL